MSFSAKHVWAALIIAAATHMAILTAIPRALMNGAIERIGASNQWRLFERVTPASRAIVRPSPDFAYSACAYDLTDGPLAIRVSPWSAYWSLSLYAGNSDNYFVIDDREARRGAAIVLVRAGQTPIEESDARLVQSPSTRGVALIRRLAPTAQSYGQAAQAARADVCALISS